MLNERTQVQDAIDMGANIRTNLGITPQIPDKQITGTPSFRGLLVQNSTKRFSS